MSSAKDYKLAYQRSCICDSFYKEGYVFSHVYQESLGSSFEVWRLKHENGNIIDVAVSRRFYEIVIKKNGKIIKEEKV